MALGWFVVTEMRRSTLEFESGPIVVKREETVALTDEEVDVYIDEILRNLSRDIVTAKQAEGLEEHIAAQEIAQGNEEEFFFEYAELLLAKESNHEAVLAYGKSMAVIFETLITTEYEYEPDIYYRLVETQDGALVGVLEERRQAYLTAARAVVDVVTPPSAAAISLEVANVFLQAADGIRDMQLAFSDPHKSLVGLNFFINRLQALYESIDDINEYLRARGVSF